MKDQFIPFRVDDDTRQQLKDTSQRLSMNSSEFLREAIWEYETLKKKVGENAVLSKKVNEQTSQNARLNERIKLYEGNKSLNRIFEQYKGYKINDIYISSLSDLLFVISENTKIEASTDNEDVSNSELDIVPIELNAEPTPQSLTEKPKPLIIKDLDEWFKHNWLFSLFLIGVSLAFFLNRFLIKMSKRPKYINHHSIELDD